MPATDVARIIQDARANGCRSRVDREYEHGLYRLAPLAFVENIITAAENAGMMGSPALYIGCGNGSTVRIRLSWRVLGCRGPQFCELPSVGCSQNPLTWANGAFT